MSLSAQPAGPLSAPEPHPALLPASGSKQIGVERSLAAAKQADIVVMVVDAEAGWTPADADIFQQMFGGSSSSDDGSSAASSSGESRDSGSDAEGAASSIRRGSAPALLVLNKTDLAAKQRQQQQTSGSIADGIAAAAAAAGVPQAAAGRFAEVVETSAATLEGMDSLRAAVLRLAGAPQVGAGLRAVCSGL